ncbi:MAG: O-antigen ligase family protein, partial [Cyanobacteria bacterium J06649_11]
TWSLPILLGSLAILFVCAVLFVEPVRERFFSIFAGRGDSSNNFRINVWMAAIEMIKDRPVIGIGPGNSAFNKIYPLYQRPNYTALSAYSVFLEVAVETGLVGFFCFLWLLVVTFNSGLLQLRRLRLQRNIQGLWLIAGIVTLAGMLAHGLVDTVWYRPQVNTIWWLMVGLVASYWKPLPKTQSNPISSSPQPTVN